MATEQHVGRLMAAPAFQAGSVSVLLPVAFGVAVGFSSLIVPLTAAGVALGLLCVGTLMTVAWRGMWPALVGVALGVPVAVHVAGYSLSLGWIIVPVALSAALRQRTLLPRHSIQTGFMLLLMLQVIAFFAWVLFGGDTGIGPLVSLGKWLGLSLVALLGGRWFESQARVESLFFRGLAIGALVAGLGVLGQVYHQFGWRVWTEMYQIHYSKVLQSSIFGWPNKLAAYMGFMALLLFGRSVHEQSALWRWLLRGATAAAAATAVATFSRFGLVGVAVSGISLLVLYPYRSSHQRRATYGIVGASLIAVAATYGNVLLDTATFGGSLGTLQVRFGIVSLIEEQIDAMSLWLGHGFQNLVDVFPIVDIDGYNQLGSLHNQYLDVFFRSGALALAAMIALVCLIARKGVAVSRTSSERSVAVNASVFASGWLGLLVSNWGQENFLYDPTGILSMLLVGWIVWKTPRRFGQMRPLQSAIPKIAEGAAFIRMGEG